MKSAENLIRALARAILGFPELEPIISITRERGANLVEVDVRPISVAPLIGSQGTMKFAIQTILAGTAHPSSWVLNFRNGGSIDSPRLKEARPQTEQMAIVVGAAVNHWKAMGYFAQGRVESSSSAVIGLMTMDDDLANSQRAAFSRIARAIGKANGYPACCIIDKPAVPA